MNFPKELRYTRDHEWARVSGSIITVGVTDHAQSALGDVVFVDLPKEPRTLKPGETFGVVESIKAVSDLYAPVGGKIVEINHALADEPSLVNSDPYGNAWMLKIEVTDAEGALSDLMSAEAYSEFVANLG
jgi:glycine cleavage system H protein